METSNLYAVSPTKIEPELILTNIEYFPSNDTHFFPSHVIVVLTSKTRNPPLPFQKPPDFDEPKSLLLDNSQIRLLYSGRSSLSGAQALVRGVRVHVDNAWCSTVHHIYPIIERKRTRAGRTRRKGGRQTEPMAHCQTSGLIFLLYILLLLFNLRSASSALCVWPSHLDQTAQFGVGFGLGRVAVLYSGAVAACALPRSRCYCCCCCAFISRVSRSFPSTWNHFFRASLYCARITASSTQNYTRTPHHAAIHHRRTYVSNLSIENIFKQSDRRRKRERREIREWPAQQGNR